MVKLVLIGYGCVGKPFIDACIKYDIFDKERITIIDKIKKEVPKGCKFINEEIKQENYIKIFDDEKLNEYDFIIDLSCYVCTSCMLRYCKNNKLHFLCTSTEHWNKPEYKTKITIADDMKIFMRNKKDMKDSATCITNAGENPGAVSWFLRFALDKIDNSDDSYANKAKKLKLRVIHISEYDTQEEIKKQKKLWRGTWSICGLYEEGWGKSEIAFGSHENKQPKGSYIEKVDGVNMCILKEKGIDVKIKSYCYDREITGCVIQHAEIFNIAHALRSKNYQPTVNYAYQYCKATEESIKILGKDIKNQKILDYSNSDGYDVVGVLLLFEGGLSWWCGSKMSSSQAREIFNTNNCGPTSSQVIGGLMTSINYCLLYPNRGLINTDDFTREEINNTFTPIFFGDIINQKVDYKPDSLQFTELII